MEVDENPSIEAVEHGVTQSGPETGITWHRRTLPAFNQLAIGIDSPVPRITGTDRLEIHQPALVRHTSPAEIKNGMQIFMRDYETASECMKYITLPRDISAKEIVKLEIVKTILGTEEEEVPRQIKVLFESESVAAGYRFTFPCDINMMFIRAPQSTPIVMTVVRKNNA